MSEEPEIRYLGDMQKINIKDGDVLVLSIDKKISEEQRANISNAVMRLKLGCEVLILDGGMKAGVLTKEQLA